jgi:hypothetical protein
MGPLWIRPVHPDVLVADLAERVPRRSGRARVAVDGTAAPGQPSPINRRPSGTPPAGPRAEHTRYACGRQLLDVSCTMRSLTSSRQLLPLA